MNKDCKIAIIGAAMKFPNVENFEDFDRVYTEKTDCVHDISEKRIYLNGLDPKKKYFPLGYLEDVDIFDYKFFEMSKSEAIGLDPQARLSLELACGAIESAGYSLSAMRGTNTAVIMGACTTKYGDLFHDETGFASTGTMSDAVSGRINFGLDLHGESSVIATACSSSLYAVYDACIKLASGTCDYALSGGVLFCFDAYEDALKEDASSLGLAASDGRCKAFDESADGISMCEGAGVVLLKRYEDALRDHDNILSVIIGCGSNHDGARSASYTAPSVTAQTELFEKVWSDYNIDPTKIGYYEAHGTGTKIGDPIEIASITQAYKKYTDKTKFCPIGSSKSNFAHAGTAAGILGILKGILSINEKKKYPLRFLNEPNRMIDFENAPVYPISELEEWNEEKRIFAINGFGSSGTNVHIIMENTDEQTVLHDEADEFLVTVSAKSENLVQEYKEKIAAGIKNEHEIGDISYVMNKCRDDYKFRTAFTAKSKEDLTEKLIQKTDCSEKEERKLIYLVSGDKTYSEAEVECLSRRYAVFNKKYNEISKYCKSDTAKNAAADAAVLFQLNAWGFVPELVIGTGRGSVSADIFNDKIKAEDMEEKASAAENSEFKKDGFIRYMKSTVQAENRKVVCVDICGKNGRLGEALKKETLENTDVLPAVTEMSLLPLAAELYEKGFDINWENYYEGTSHNRIMLPTYPFEKISVWPSKIIPQNGGGVQTANADENENYDNLSFRDFLLKTWQDLLQDDSITADDDLFDAGANSMVSLAVIQKIHERTGVMLEFDNLYEYYTVNDIADYVESKMESRLGINQAKQSLIKRVERTDHMIVSGNQKRMLFILEDVPNKSIYNMPLIFSITGDLNEKAFKKSILEIIDMNEILHTVYSKKDGVYYQRVLEQYEPEIVCLNVSAMDDSLIDELIRKRVEKPFDLFNEIPVRCCLLKKGANEWIWLMNVHHIAADGSSLALFIGELNLIYNSKVKNIPLDLKKPEIQFADYAAYEAKFMESQEAARQLEYWKKELNGVSGILHFPMDKEMPEIRQYTGKGVNVVFESSIRDEAQKFARQNNLTLFMLMESVYAILLHRYSSENDLCVGVPIANRDEDEAKEMIGFFANTMVVRSRFEDDQSIMSFIGKNKETILGAFENSRAPFEEVVANVQFERYKNYTPLFQYAFTMQNFASGEIQMEGVTIKSLWGEDSVSKFDMLFSVAEENGEIHGYLEYDTELFSEALIDQFIEDYKAVLNAVINEPEKSVDQIEINTFASEESENLEDSLFD